MTVLTDNDRIRLLEDRVAQLTTNTTFEIRLAALDRAINRLQASHEATPDEVVALADKFERYLTAEK